MIVIKSDLTTKFLTFVSFVMVGFMIYMVPEEMEFRSIRARVEAAVATAVETRKAIEALVKEGYTLGTLPVNPENIRKANSGTIGEEYVSRVSYDKDGVISITLSDHQRLGEARNKTIRYAPTLTYNEFEWKLIERTEPRNYSPIRWIIPSIRYIDKFQAIENGTDRKTIIAELGEPITTTKSLFLIHSTGEKSNYEKLPETIYYLAWEYQGSGFVVGFDKNNRSTEKVDGFSFPCGADRWATSATLNCNE